MKNNAARALVLASVVGWVAALPKPQDLGADCDVDALGDCVLPLEDDISACSTEDLDCLCGTLTSLVSCYDSYCPNANLPSEVGQAIAACDSVGSGGGGTGGFPDDGSDDGDDGIIDPTDDDFADPEPTDDGIISDDDDTLSVTDDPAPTGGSGGGIVGGNDDDADQTDDEDDGPRATEIVDAPASTRTRAPQTTSSDAAAGGLVAPVGGLLGGLLAVLAWL